MMNENLPIQVDQFRSFAAKAVQGYLRYQFDKFFSDEEIEDIISDVVVRMWRSSGSFDPDKGAFSTWVGTIARNVVKSAAMAKKRRCDVFQPLEDDVDEDCQDDILRTCGWSADGELLAEEMLDGFNAKLRTDRDRRFLAWQVEGLSADEMAQREGVSVNNVHLILFKMRRRLNRAA